MNSQKALLEQQLLRNGGIILPLPDGPYIEAFNALELAQAIEHEINRCHLAALSKIRIEMKLEDAHELANCLRRAAATGG
jgi:hypothetical protein